MLQLNPHDVILGDQCWRLDEGQADLVRATLDAIPIDPLPFQGNDLIEYAACSVLQRIGYELRSPLMIDDEARAAAMSERPRARDAQDGHDEQRAMFERLQKIAADLEDVTRERDDLLSQVGRQTGPPADIEPVAGRDAASEWDCHCGCTNVPWNEACPQCSHYRPGHAKSFEPDPRSMAGHPLGPDGGAA